MSLDYGELICVENLFRLWRTYKKGKSQKADVIEFEGQLENNLFSLRRKLQKGDYVHDKYPYFRISDPKKRDIYKSTVRDRIVRQALYVYLCEIYEPISIKYSFSSRKGAHKGVATLLKVAKHFKKEKKQCLAVKCDI